MRFFCAILIVLASCLCRAGNPPIIAAEIPFQFRDGFIWIKVSVPQARGSLNFLLDSGAQASVIHAATAQRLGVTRGRPTPVAGVGTTTTGFWTQVVDARASGIRLPRSFLMLDLSSLSEACTNATVDGIIGADFFKDRIVQIDYRWGVVRMLSEPPAATPWTRTIPLKVRPCGILVPVQINDSGVQWVRLDTGCASALQWVTSSVNPVACTIRVAVALTSFSVPVTKTTLTLGTVRFEDVPTDLHSRELFPGEKGLLGNGVLSQFQTVTMDLKHKKLTLGDKPTNPRFVSTGG